MLKKIKLKNSTILLTGIIIIVIGISFGLYEYFAVERNNTFSKMNILLYENENPKTISDNNNFSDISDEELQTKPIETLYNYSGILEIPRINLKRGFFNVNSKYNNVDLNITVINGSTMPNIENNNLILAAHSGVCPVCFFDSLYKLGIGDSAYIYFEGSKYNYKIVKIYEVKKDGTVAIYRDSKKHTLTLITCTRNSSTKQTVYILELV